jgi:hypothetical protein
MAEETLKGGPMHDVGTTHIGPCHNGFTHPNGSTKPTVLQWSRELRGSTDGLLTAIAKWLQERLSSPYRSQTGSTRVDSIGGRNAPADRSGS